VSAQLATEIELARRTARDCQLVLHAAGGVPLVPHEEVAAREARLRLAAALGVRL